MANAFASFDKRLKQIDRKNRKLARGYRNKIMPNGTIQPRPTSQFRLPVKGFVMLGVGFFAFKGFMLASIGAVTYDERLELLNSGTAVERAGAWIMQVDPVTDFVATQMATHLL